MIATDPLSLLFIACFLTGLVFFIVTALLGNLGHGLTHNVAHHVGAMHTTSTHAVDNGPAHTAGQAAGSHGTFQAHANTQGQHQTSLSFINPTSVMLFLLGFGFFGYFFHTTIHVVAALTLILASIGGIAIAEVDTWEHFIHEDGTSTEASYSDELDKLRTLLDSSNTEDSQLVMRKDLQKE